VAKEDEAWPKQATGSSPGSRGAVLTRTTSRCKVHLRKCGRWAQPSFGTRSVLYCEGMPSSVTRMQRAAANAGVNPGRNVLQPYCNRADTHWYVMDKATPPDSRKPPKQAQFPDAPVRARTCASKLVMSRSAVRVRSSALYFTCKSRKNAKPPTRTSRALSAVRQQ